MRENDGRCRPANTRHQMMLGGPIAMIAQCFGMLGKRSRFGECGGDIAAKRHGNEIENGKLCHDAKVGIAERHGKR